MIEPYSVTSRVAQWKRAGPITQRSVDRNHALLRTFFFLETFRFLVDSTFTHNHIGGFRTQKKSIRSYEMYIHSILLQQLVQLEQ